MKERNDVNKPILLDYKEAANFLGFSEFTLRIYVSLGMVLYIKLGPTLVRFQSEALECWLDSRRVEPVTRSAR